MGVDKIKISTSTQTKPTFMQRVGKWFNKNGNAVGKAMQVTGTTAMGAGMTGMFIDAMNKPSSIFGCGNYSPYSMMGGCGMFGGCCSPYSYGMMNPIMMNPMMMSMNGSLFGCC